MLGDIFNVLLLQPTINLLALILRVIESMHISGALGLSIILLTVLIKLLLWPFTAKQIRYSKDMQSKMAELRPKLDALKKKHKNDQLALSKAQNELYKEAGLNPAGGCLPALIPFIVIIPLYQSVTAFVNGQAGLTKVNYFLYSGVNHLSKLPDPHFLGMNLASKPQEFFSKGVDVNFLVVLVPIITALLQFVLSKMMMPTPVKPYPGDTGKETKEKISTDESIAQMQNSMVYYMPVVFGFIAFSFPVGLSLYIITLNIVSIWQQYLISGWGGMESIIKKAKLT